jgi:SAP domain-containing protein
MADALSPTMTLRDFENGYWYLAQLKNFAERIGIPAAKKLRKDELEKAIVAFLRTGKAALPTKRSLRKTGVKDVERGLNLTELKELDVPKDYASWVKARAKRKGKSSMLALSLRG